jgi:hypothetical protein
MSLLMVWQCIRVFADEWDDAGDQCTDGAFEGGECEYDEI